MLMKNKIVIDIRMINKSGIGVYIRELVPEIIKYFKDTQFYLLYNKKDDIGIQFTRKNVSLVIINSKLYTLKEQYEIRHKYCLEA